MNPTWKPVFFFSEGRKRNPNRLLCPWPLLLLIKNAVVLASLWFWASEHSGLFSFLLCKIGIESFSFPYIVLRIKGKNNSHSTEKLTSVMGPAVGWIWGCEAHDYGGPAALFEVFTVLLYACVTHVCSVASVMSKSFATPRLCCPWNFPGQNTGVGLPFPPPGDLPSPGVYPPLLQLLHWQVGSSPLGHLGSMLHICVFFK